MRINKFHYNTLKTHQNLIKKLYCESKPKISFTSSYQTPIDVNAYRNAN